MRHFCQRFMLGTPCCWSVPILDPPETSEVSRNAHEGIFRWHIWFLPRTDKRIKSAWRTRLCSTSCSGSCVNGFLAPDWYVVLGPTPTIDVLSELGPFCRRFWHRVARSWLGRTYATFGRVSPTGHPCLSPCVWT